ncbi:MAG TPA: HD domain-containing protein, partial [Gammaproteobacteria bacterium]|nr:HD domain-containing protein [Gammaproteobacteria bacterium]
MSPELAKTTLDSVVVKLLVGTKHMEIIDVISPRTSVFSRQRNLIDNIRKMLLAMVDDIRIVLIKLAERLVYLRYLQHQPETIQKEIAKKAMDIYAPLANRLGIGQFKWQMEDLAFRYLNPKEYSEISNHINMQRHERESYVQSIIAELKTLLPHSLAENAKISGRPKHIYSIYRKMHRKHV